MLRFIKMRSRNWRMTWKFQYISCYGLSWYCRQNIIKYLYFNTSHVTVYHDIADEAETRQGFQYISCYGLSSNRRSGRNDRRISIHLMLRFIPCICKFCILRHIISIHLMLRFIFFKKMKKYCCFCISIHLMLRFINLFFIGYGSGLWISIHLMLRFILSSKQKRTYGNHISIHLVLRFIIAVEQVVDALKLFQYISCYGLSLYRQRAGKRI